MNFDQHNKNMSKFFPLIYDSRTWNNETAGIFARSSRRKERHNLSLFCQCCIEICVYWKLVVAFIFHHLVSWFLSQVSISILNEESESLRARLSLQCIEMMKSWAHFHGMILNNEQWVSSHRYLLFTFDAQSEANYDSKAFLILLILHNFLLIAHEFFLREHKHTSDGTRLCKRMNRSSQKMFAFVTMPSSSSMGPWNFTVFIV